MSNKPFVVSMLNFKLSRPTIAIASIWHMGCDIIKMTVLFTYKFTLLEH